MVLPVRNAASKKKWIVSVTRVCYTLWLRIIGMPLRVSGHLPEHKCIYIANHTSYLDSINIFAVIHQHFRSLGKYEMISIPLYGYFYQHTVITVDRKSPGSRAKSILQMKKHLSEEGSLVIFPEGTFNETGNVLKDFYDGAFWLAIHTQTPIVPIIFPDAINRWHHSAWWKLWPGINRAICLNEISVNGLTLADVEPLRKLAFLQMQEALLEYHKGAYSAK
jgi:1-acyl-sn-glycerol-3-phosphate acyltransferase